MLNVMFTVVLAPLQSALGFRLFPRQISGWSMEGVEVDSTPSIRHLEKILFEKVESPGLTKVGRDTCRRVDWYSNLGFIYIL
jgi:hypothetical protein